VEGKTVRADPPRRAHPVNPPRRRKWLPPPVDPNKRRDGGGECVAPLLRRDGGVRRQPLVDDPPPRDPEEPLAHAPLTAGAGMREERGHGVLEHTLLEKVDLSATALLCRRAHELDPRLQIRRLCGRGEECADDGHRDEVVAAAVPDVREGVVLSEERDGRTRRTDPRAERGRKPSEVPLDLVAVLLEK